ncbi:hypothetical protein TWF694_011038 [Orbilia ellipsospora]|uniref:Uncharacterized protein n=1 Tax=Orbilia ellipsospora TaxID=2528407 RepID=A0AAV9X862_9PEZI
MPFKSPISKTPPSKPPPKSSVSISLTPPKRPHSHLTNHTHHQQPHKRQKLSQSSPSSPNLRFTRSNPSSGIHILTHHQHPVRNPPYERNPYDMTRFTLSTNQDSTHTNTRLHSSMKVKYGDNSSGRPLENNISLSVHGREVDGKKDREGQSLSRAVQLSRMVRRKNTGLSLEDEKKVEEKVQLAKDSLDSTSTMEKQEEKLERVREKARLEISWDKTRQMTKKNRVESTAKLSWSEITRNCAKKLGESPKQDLDVKSKISALTTPRKIRNGKGGEKKKEGMSAKTLLTSFTSNPGLSRSAEGGGRHVVDAEGLTRDHVPRRGEMNGTKKTARAGDGFLTFQRLREFNERYGQGIQSAIDDGDAMREDIRRAHRKYIEQYM